MDLFQPLVVIVALLLLTALLCWIVTALLCINPICGMGFFMVGMVAVVVATDAISAHVHTR